MLPRRFRSSALRASGAGRLATDRSGRLTQCAVAGCRQGRGAITEFGIESCPQFVVIAAVAPSSLGVAVNTACSRSQASPCERLVDKLRPFVEPWPQPFALANFAPVYRRQFLDSLQLQGRYPDSDTGDLYDFSCVA
ncbi:MAG: hypothetical protein ACT4NP_13230 [Pseudonocardiales bacterium]